MKRLSGKVAIVTGASRGIGSIIAEKLASEGAKVVINFASSKDQAQKLADTISQKGGTATIVKADVSQTNEVAFLFDEALRQYGRIDLLIDNAGILVNKLISELTEEEFDKIFSVNVKGTFFSCQSAARKMSPGGKIINLSSSVLGVMLPTYGAYAATKGAVEQLTRVLARELGAKGISVNAVAPGPTETDLFLSGKSNEQISRLAQMSSFNRLGTPEDIANVVAYLCSDESRWITGQTIRVNGGFS